MIFKQAKKWHKDNAHLELSCGSELKLDNPSESLIKAAKETFREMKITYTTRNWLDIVAVRV